MCLLQHEFELHPASVLLPLKCFAIFCCSVLPPGGYSQDNCGSVASFLRSAASSSGLPRDLDDVTIPDFSDVSGFFARGRGRGHGVSSMPARLLFWFYCFSVHFTMQGGLILTACLCVCVCDRGDGRLFCDEAEFEMCF